MNKHTSAKGKPVNMQALAKAHENERAVSNVPINAKGDIIDTRGEVKVAREDIKKQYYKDTIVGDSATVGIKDEEQTVITPKPVEQMTQTEALDELAKMSQEVSRTVRTRDDGTSYYEIEYEDGSMVQENIVR